MSPDDVLRGLAAFVTVVSGTLGVVVRVMWGRLETTRKDLDDLRVAVERDHPSNTDFREFSERIVRAVDRMSEQMGRLQSEIHNHAIALARNGK